MSIGEIGGLTIIALAITMAVAKAYLDYKDWVERKNNRDD